LRGKRLFLGPNGARNKRDFYLAWAVLGFARPAMTDERDNGAKEVRMLIRSAIGRCGPALAAPALLALLVSCSSPGGMPGGTLPPPNVVIVTQKEPPPPKAETIPPPPAAVASEYFVWDPGHWHWTGTGFFWIPGHYIERVYQGRVWVQGGWTYSDLTWTWTPGHWS